MSLILDGTNGLSDVDGTAAAPAIRGTDTNTGIFFPAADTIAFAEGGVEAMRIDSSGNVGIGTSSPGHTLDVAGNARSNAWIGRSNTSAPSTDAAIYRAADNTLAFSTASTERARIDSSGNLLVGTTSSTSPNPGFSVYVQGAGNTQAIIGHSTSSGSGQAYVVCAYNGGTIGSITQNGTTAVSYNTSSDYRLKHDIQPMTGALANVQQLKPVTYKWNADGSDGQGFIAHELAEVCPDAVTGGKDAVDAEGNILPQGIDTSFLVATLTAALQEAHGLIKNLEQRVAALEAA